MNALLSHPFVWALAAGLLHSLWFIPLLVVAGHLMACLANTSRRRYQLYLTSLLLLPVCFAVACYVNTPLNPLGFFESNLIAKVLPGPTSESPNTEASTLSLPYWPATLSTLYVFGLLFAVGMGARNHAHTRYLRRGGKRAGAPVQKLFGRLREELSPTKWVTLRITDRVNEILITGLLRPMILIPAGLLNQLSIDEVEAILCHELTHLRRNDLWCNAAQEAIRALFFYHPVVYWLCRRLDTEREFARDDAVIRQFDPDTYAHALIRVAKYSLHPHKALTVAATNSQTFTQRIQRLFAPPGNHRPLRLTVDMRVLLLTPLLFLPLVGLLSLSPFGRPASGPNDDSLITTEAPVVLMGQVLDGATGDPLIGAVVRIQDGKDATVTDFNGKYRLVLEPGNYGIVVEYVGYNDLGVQIDLKEDAAANVNLYKDRPSALVMQPTSAEFTVDDFPQIEGNQMDDSAEGQPSRTGVTVMGSGGIPDDVLWIVDGKIIKADPTNDLDPDTIESISVVKGRAKVAALGHGAEHSAAIIIVTRRE